MTVSIRLPLVCWLLGVALLGVASTALAQAGAISGTVRQKVTGAPLSDIKVSARTEDGTLVAQAITNAAGEYTLGGLASRFYYLSAGKTLAEFLPEAYGCGYECAGGAPVAVLPGQTTSGIDFSLGPPAAISGTVTRTADGTPVAFQVVRLTRSDGGFAATASTNSSGAYSSALLPGGAYYVTTINMPGLVDERHPDVPCDPTCAPDAGVSVVVIPGQAITGIDFALASDPAPGTITGSVRQEGTAIPVGSAPISVYNALGVSVAGTLTNGTGSFAVAVAPGTYFVRTNLGPPFQNYQNELFNETWCGATCDVTSGTPVVVTPGATTGGVDFTVAPGSSISGVVTAAGGGPIGGIAVNVVTPNGTMVATSSTGGSGTYTIPVVPGTYFVETAIGASGSFADERYENANCVPGCTSTQGTPVVVDVGTSVTGINLTLDSTWALTGTVTNASTGAPLAGVQVQIFNQHGQLLRTLFPTSGSGFYSAQLAAGTYYLATGLVPTWFGREVYDNVPCAVVCNALAGTPVVITAGATTVADFALSPPGAIAGWVVHSDTAAPLSARIEARRPDGSLVNTAVTEANGDYLLVVPPGQYRVLASPQPGGVNVVPEFFDDVPCPVNCSVTTGTPVVVTSGQTMPDVNFTLGPKGTISGTVIVDGGGGLAGIQVVAHLSDGTPFAGTATNVWGGYTLSAAPGTYFLRTRAPVAMNYIDELYGGTPCAPACAVTAGTPVVVAAAATTTSVNFSLAPGGLIAGRVVDAASGAGLYPVTLELSTSAGELVGTALTNTPGYFTFGGLATGSYRIRTVGAWERGYADMLFDGLPCAGCAATLGTAVNVTAGAVASEVNLALVPGGAFFGHVRSAPFGGALASIPIHIYAANGRLVRTTFSASDGSFTANGLPAGTYFARTGSDHHVNVWYGGLTCNGSCQVPAGSTIAVTVGSTTTGVDFDLTVGGTLSGSVVDGTTLQPIPADPGALVVELFSADGVFQRSTGVDGAGRYTFTGLAAGSYRVRTSNLLGYLDEQFDNLVCPKSCVPAAGSTVNVVGGTTTASVNFALAAGGRIAGTVTNAQSAAAIPGVLVRVYAADGTRVAEGETDAAGAYLIAEGLPSGTYYARTFAATGFVDQIYVGLAACLPGCLPTEGTPIVVTTGATTSGIDFPLQPGTELVYNGSFSLGTAGWMAYATPSMDYMPWSVASGMFEFSRLPAPAGTANQAVIFQNTAAPVQPGAALVAQFDLGNTSAERKRLSVVIHDADFGDLSVCTFWLPAHLVPTRFVMRTRTTRLWTNATIAFYGASTNVPDGRYQVDNVSLQSPSSVVIERTDCVEPTPPPGTGGPDGPELLVNGDFTSGALTPGWSTWGQITTQVAGGVAEFVRPAGTPAGVLFQATGQAVATRTPLTATLKLGNSSTVRKRVTMILHDNDFSDLSACTFWLAPGQPLLPYTYRAFTTKAWTNATLSIYPATVGTDEWIRFDDASLRITPGSVMAGVECIEPDGGSWGSGHGAAPEGDAGRQATVPPPAAFGPTVGGTDAASATTSSISATDADDVAIDGWIADGFAWTGAGWVAEGGDLATGTLTRVAPLNVPDTGDVRVTFESWLDGHGSASALFDVSLDGVTWLPWHLVDASDTWVPVEVDLSEWRGTSVYIRLRFDGGGPAPGDGTPAVWRVRGVASIESSP